jgi:hypothetical protein
MYTMAQPIPAYLDQPLRSPGIVLEDAVARSDGRAQHAPQFSLCLDTVSAKGVQERDLIVEYARSLQFA